MYEASKSAIKTKTFVISEKQKDSIRSILERTDEVLEELSNNNQQFQLSKKDAISKEERSLLLKYPLLSIDKHYNMLLKCIDITINASYNVFLQPYTQEYYVFDMKLHLFPLTLDVTKIISEGTLYVGFNEQYPGLQKPNLDQKDPLSQIKLNLDKVKSIQITQPGTRNIHKIYFLFSSSKKCLKLQFRLVVNQFDRDLQKPFFQKKNVLNLIDEKLTSPVRKIRVKTQLSPKYSMTKTSYLQKLEAISTKDKLKTFTNNFSLNQIKKINSETISVKNLTKTLLFDEFNTTSLLRYPRNRQQNLSKTQLENISMCSFLRTHIKFSTEQKFKISQSNLKQLQKYREKTEKLKILVEKFKHQIQTMKNLHDEKKLKQKKINKNLSAMIGLLKFHKISYFIYLKRKKYLNRFYSTFFNVSKFIHKLKKKREASLKLVPQNLFRISYGILPLTELLAATIYEHSEQKAQKCISQTIRKIFFGLLLNQSFQKSQEYLNKAVRIQRFYRQRLDCQRYMLKVFCFKAVNSLTAKFPHFTKFEKFFQEKEICVQLISDYLKDQNLKLSQGIRNYRKQLKQRDQMIELKLSLVNKARLLSNNKIKKFQNKLKPSKIELQIVKTAQNPSKRLFRNLDILQSMIRNWFQLQNFVYLKKEKAKIWY